MTTSEKVYSIVTQIPSGRVMSYGQIARLVGIKNARQIGWILHRNSDPKHIPCHRVIRSDGTVATGYAFGGPDGQRKLLESELVAFEHNKITSDCFYLI